VLARDADEASLVELARWEELSRSADHDDAPVRDLSSLRTET
jgi:hypothetical protein